MSKIPQKYLGLLVVIILFSVVLLGKFYYPNFSVNTEKKLDIAAESLMQNGDDNQIEHWIKIAGIKKILEAVHKVPRGTNFNCHTAMHKLGKLSYQVNPEDAFSVFEPYCASGFTHGVMEGYINKNGFTLSGIEKICSNIKGEFKQGECAHGVGHGLMAYEDYDLPKALNDCQNLHFSSLSLVACLDGVFMENIIASQGENLNMHPTKWVSDDPLFPCNAVEDKENMQRACYANQIIRMLELNQNNSSEVISSCNSLAENAKTGCAYSIGVHINMLVKKIETAEIIGLCEKIENRFNNCTAGALRYLIKFSGRNIEGIPYEVCKTISDTENKRKCYFNLGRYLNEAFSADETEIKNKCALLENGFKEECLKGSKVN